MFEIYLNYILLVVSIVYIIDFSGIISSIKKGLSYLIIRKAVDTYSLKPLDCSTCLSFWSTLIYGFTINQPIIYTVFLAVLSSILSTFIYNLIRDLYAKLY